MESLEERDPAATRALEEGTYDRERRIEKHETEIRRHRHDLCGMYETLGMIRARHPELDVGL
jgi:hypothetical protein